MAPQLIFISHPMTECADSCSGFNDWRTCEKKHCRRFIRSQGDYLDGKKLHHDKQLFFWGEWEAKAGIEFLPSPCFPSQVCTPLYSTVKKKIWVDAYLAGNKSVKHHNTDPFVFGDHFLYANCLQDHKSLSHPFAPGSLILFGGCDPNNKNKVLLDTVFVVHKSISYSPEALVRAYYANGQSLTIPYKDHQIDRGFIEISTLPLFYYSHSLRKKRYTLYFGKTYQDCSQMFSFTPCRPYSRHPCALFSPVNVTSILPSKFISKIQKEKPAVKNISAKKLHAKWKKIRKLTVKNGCKPAVRLNSPQS